MAKVIDAILEINPNAKVVTRGSTIDSIEIDWLNGTAEISKADIKVKLTELNNNEIAEAATKEDKKASGKQKLKDLGLDDDEIKALIGA
jgi:hypothetical protein